MTQSPRLLAVPSFVNELTIKATQTGIVLLRDGRFKKRYTGSRYSAVDINGKFYEKSADLKKELDKTREVRTIKKGRLSPQASPNELHVREQGTEKKLPTKECEYRVNKIEVRQRIMAMINTQKGGRELYFWTVTFPKGTGDDLAYQAFNTWLTTLRQSRMLRDYIWIAERQEIGTVHFHIAIPHKMSVVHANRMMRVTLSTFAKKGLIPFNVHQCKRYNGVDICKNRKTGRVTNFAIKKGSRALVNYLTKYVTKNDAGFSHLAWHNSRGFSSLFTGITFTVAEFVQYGFNTVLVRKSIISNQFFSFYAWRGEPPEAITKHLYELNSYVQTLAENRTK